ncbi:MAG: hypothetical protein WC627_09960 [Legionella sp.]|jgi:hypothetical protein
MAIEVKDFGVLKKHFDDTVDIVVKDKGKKSVEELEDPRKTQVQFLQLVITELDKNTTKLSPQHKSFAFYGAMLLVSADISKNFGITSQHSLLLARLRDAMGITSSKTATPEQEAKFYRVFNKFLAFIYKDKDAHKGLIKDFGSNKIELDNLIALVKFSYKLERNAHKNEASALTTGELLNPVHPADFDPPSEVSDKIIEAVGGWAKLQESLHDLIKEELRLKRVGGITNLDKPRSTQMQFLEMVQTLLLLKPEPKAEAISQASSSSAAAATSSSTPAAPAKDKQKPKNTNANNNNAKPAEAKTAGLSDNHKTIILAGAMFIVRGLISMEYTESYGTKYRSPLSKKSISSSTIHTGLTNILKATSQSYEDIKIAVSATNQYLRFLAIDAQVNKKNEQATVIRPNNRFSEIPGFDLADYLNKIQKMIYICRVFVIKAWEPPKTQKQQASTFGGYGFSMFGTKAGSSSAADDSDVDEEDDEEVKDATANKSTTAPTATAATIK